jgi:hypothetical protein
MHAYYFMGFCYIKFSRITFYVLVITIHNLKHKDANHIPDLRLNSWKGVNIYDLSSMLYGKIEKK